MVTDLYNVGQVDHDQWSVRSRSGRSWVTDLYDVGQADHDLSTSDRSYQLQITQIFCTGLHHLYDL